MGKEANDYTQADVEDYLSKEKERAANVFKGGTSSVRFMNLGGKTVGAWVEKDEAGHISGEAINLRP